MHKLQLAIVAANSTTAARTAAAENIDACAFSGDWFIIGGRWSGLLSPTRALCGSTPARDFRKHPEGYRDDARRLTPDLTDKLRGYTRTPAGAWLAGVEIYDDTNAELTTLADLIALPSLDKFGTRAYLVVIDAHY